MGGYVDVLYDIQEGSWGLCVSLGGLPYYVYKLLL